MHLPKLFKNKMEQVIAIKTAGYTTVALSELHDFQGDFKELSEEDYVKMRNTITARGFRYPILFWTDEAGIKWTIDGNQRHTVLTRMQNEGWTIPPLPANPIFADNREDAKEEILFQTLQYGKITEGGWDSFTEDLPMDDIEDMLSIPDFEDEAAEDDEQDNTDSTPPAKPAPKPKEEKKITCPNCQTIITLDK